MDTIFMNSENSRTSEYHVLVLNPFSSSVTFLYPLETSENHRFSNVFRGYRNVTLD